MKLDTFTCEVSIAGETVMEYGEETSENGRCKTAYIASKEGKPFSILVDLSSDPKNDDKKFFYHLYVDGELAGRYYTHVGATGFEPKVIDSTSLQTPESNGFFLQRALKFKGINAVDNTHRDGVENRPAVIKELGTIKIIIWSCVLLRTEDPTTMNPPERTNVKEPQAIPESKIKGRNIKHRATLGPPTYEAKMTYYTDLIHSTKKTLIFKYSSKESLIYQGIIPHQANVVDYGDKASDRDQSPQLKLEEMNFEQMRAELRRRRERDAEDDELHHKVKKEIKQEARRGPIISNGHAETIDLTGDD